jgi:hypothetical protein
MKPKPNAQRRCVTLALITLALSLSFALPAARAQTPRILYVSPDPLPAVAPDRQFRTIADAATVAGDTVRIESGVYRESVTVTAQQPIPFEADIAANVVLTGADRLTKWTADDSAAPARTSAGPPGPTNSSPTRRSTPTTITTV